MISRFNITIIFILVIVGVGIGLIRPQYQEFQILQLEIEKSEYQIRRQNERLKHLRSLSDELKEYQTELSIIDVALPKETFLPLLFDFIQKTSSQNGLLLEEISASVAPPAELNIQEIVIDLSLSGSYSSFKDFLYSLENSARLIEVASLNFSSPKEQEALTFNFELTIKTHFKE